MAIYIAGLGAGLGDVVVVLPVLQSLIAADQPVVFVSRSNTQTELMAMVPGLAGILRQPEFAEKQLRNEDIFVDCEAHLTMRMASADWRRFKVLYPETQINEFLEMICADQGISVDFHQLTPLPFARHEIAAGKVLLVPGTTSDSKAWPRAYWLQLQTYLEKQGHQVALLGKADCIPVAELISDGIQCLSTPTIAEAMNAVSSASAVVSVDTGLMHLAVHQATPTVSFCNYASFWRRKYPNLRQLATTKCNSLCAEHGLKIDSEHEERRAQFYEGRVWSDEDFYFCRVDIAERCIASIRPEQVIEALRQVAVVSA